MRSHADASELLEVVMRVCGEGLAENESDEEEQFFRQYLPIPRHLRGLDPQVKLIIGDKGAGKSQLFRALKFEKGRKLLGDLAAAHRLRIPPLESTRWLVGFETAGTAFPAPDVVDRFARGRSVEDLRLLWLLLLVHVLLGSGELDQKSLPQALVNALTSSEWKLADATNLLADPDVLARLFAALDGLDHALASSQRVLIVSYDELDRVSINDWALIQKALQGLVQLWATYSRRWRRISPKIFLRRDLYEHAAFAGPDIAKVAWNPAELLWSSGELYAMLFKRLINGDERLRDYLQKGRLAVEERELLGLVPTGREESEFARPVKYMFGEHMGSDPKKGLTLRWIPNHLKDGHGRLFPRPLLRLVQEAAKIERRDQRAASPRLLDHMDLREALDRVSEFRVDELEREEFPWLRPIKLAFRDRPFMVPAERRDVLRSLDIDWSKQQLRPPATDPEGVLDYLVELGIASIRSDAQQRIDIGDLYLKGLHLKRKGGVARPKRPAGGR